MDLSKIGPLDYERAMKLTKDIQREAQGFECEFYGLIKERDKLKKKK